MHRKTVYDYLNLIKADYDAKDIKHLRLILTNKAPINSKYSRDLDILEKMSLGLSLKEVASELNLSLVTIKAKVRRMRNELDVGDNYQLISYYFWRYKVIK